MPRFSDDFIRRVRDANDIAQVVESYNIPLRRTGGNMLALCPFHDEKTPSFNVNPADQYFKCFGCDAKGDVITFVQRMERLDFMEAVESLANRAGIPVVYERGQGRDNREQDTESRKALRWINSKTLAYFEESLADERRGGRAREYLLARGFTRQTIISWHLGWAPENWDGLLSYLVRLAGESKRGKIIEAGIRAGVLRQRDDGSAYDAFRGRVMFPIFDARNQPIGFGGRILEEKAEAGGKYINTSEGKLFQKRKLLYGLNFAAKEIGLQKTAIIVEGYTDTVMCHQHGIRNVVATLGTSLTNEHLRLLRRYIQQEGKAIALFDADEAGERATERAVRLAMEEDVPLMVARGLEVKDACEFLPRFGAEHFCRELEKAEDAFSYTMRLAQESAGNNVSQQATAVERVMGVVNLSPNPVARAMMRRKVATAFKVPEETLPKPKAAAPANRERVTRPGLSANPAARLVLEKREKGRTKRELRILQYMLESAEWCDRISKCLPPGKFRDPACAELADLIRHAWQNAERPRIQDLKRKCVHEGSAAMIVDLAVPGHELEFSDWELQKALERFAAEEIDMELREINSKLEAPEIDAASAAELSLKKLELTRKLASLK